MHISPPVLKTVYEEEPAYEILEAPHKPMPNLDNFDPLLLHFSEKLINQNKLVVFSSMRSQICATLIDFIKKTSTEDSFMTIVDIEPNNIMFDEQQEMTFYGRDVSKCLEARFSTKIVPIVFFEGELIGGTMDTISMMAQKSFWCKLT